MTPAAVPYAELCVTSNFSTREGPRLWLFHAPQAPVWPGAVEAAAQNWFVQGEFA